MFGIDENKNSCLLELSDEKIRASILYRKELPFFNYNERKGERAEAVLNGYRTHA